MKSGVKTIGAHRRERGYMLPLVILLVTVMTGTVTGLISISSTRYVKSTSDGDVSSAVYIAEAGISDTMAQLNNTTSFSGYPDASRKVFFNEPTKGRGEYSTTVVDNGNKTVTITSIGHYYRNNTTPSASAATQKRTIRVLALRTENPIQHNIVAGAGGIAVQGTNLYYPWYGSKPGTTGSVYSRGKIALSGGSATLGTVSESVNVVAANEGCGNTTNWPQLCGNTSQPLIFDNGSKIYGTVCATNQSASADILPGPTGSGLTPNCQAPVYKKVRFDKAGFAAAATNTMTNTAASCNTGAFQSGSVNVTYAANTRITGNVTVNSDKSWLGGRCVITVAGDVYIKGDFTLTGDVRMVVAESAGTRKPKIVVNGKIRIAPEKTTTAGVFANSQGTPMAMIGFWSTDNAAGGCSQSDSCVELSTAHAYNSAYRDLTNLSSFMSMITSDTNLAISIEGDEDGKVDGLMAYAYFGIMRFNKPGNSSMYGMGGEGLVIKPCPASNPFLCFATAGGVTVTGDAPYNGVLYYDQYTILDYQQVY